MFDFTSLPPLDIDYKLVESGEISKKIKLEEYTIFKSTTFALLFKDNKLCYGYSRDYLYDVENNMRERVEDFIELYYDYYKYCISIPYACEKFNEVFLDLIFSQNYFEEDNGKYICFADEEFDEITVFSQSGDYVGYVRYCEEDKAFVIGDFVKRYRFFCYEGNPLYDYLYNVFKDITDKAFEQYVYPNIKKF